MENDSIKAEEEVKQVETVKNEGCQKISPVLVTAGRFLIVGFIYRLFCSLTAGKKISKHSDHFGAFALCLVLVIAIIVSALYSYQSVSEQKRLEKEELELKLKRELEEQKKETV